MLMDATVNANAFGQLPVPANIIQGKRLSTEHKVKSLCFQYISKSITVS